MKFGSKKIALVLYPINDLGGIINHAEQLALGLRELGHTVNLHILYWQESFRYPPPDKFLLEQGWVRGAFGMVHQQKGWAGKPWKEKLSYKGRHNRKKTMDILGSYDVVIWEVPVPSKSKANEGNLDWIPLYSACKKSIAVLHDGNLFSIPWIAGISRYFYGLACVHECSYNLGGNLDIPRAMILNPQDLSGIEYLNNYEERQEGFLSIQVFKSWKHVDEVIRAIPYLPRDNFRKIIAGGGIEQRYMVSKEKIKPKYLCRYEDDPDIRDSLVNNGITIWENALMHGMEYYGFVSSFRRDILLSQVRTLIDPSWSFNYNEHGSHFNRVIVDAMKMGVIPVAVNLGMSSNESGESVLFKPDRNYIMIPQDSWPREYAERIRWASSLPKEDHQRIIENNYNLLNFFDRKKVAEDFLRLAYHKRCGVYDSLRKGKISKKITVAANEGIKFFRPKSMKFRKRLKKKG